MAPDIDNRRNIDDAHNENPAASMSLLQAILDDPLGWGSLADDDVHQQKKTAPERIFVLILAAILAFITTVSVRGLLDPDKPGANVATHLIAQIEQHQQTVKRLETEVDELNGKIKVYSASDTSARRATPQVRQLAQLDALEGPGLTITVAEAADAEGKGRVQDSDLRALINSLWEGHAEGIAVNGIRIGPTTAVRTAGGVILVDFEAIEAPYVVSAIGDSEVLHNSVSSGRSGEYFSVLYSMYGISLSYKQESNLSLKPADIRTQAAASIDDPAEENE
ncbi:MAG: DUF881 domain-containing protein [Actinomycetaceae bacterium]|nr:DUF881 domain-containing protein [Actinomycetaceae bacterium]